jgi:ABC-2 type transport system permease protein
MHYLRLWRQFAVNAFVREAEYRANFVIGLVEGLIQLGLAVLTFGLLYRFTDEVAGWTQAQILMLVGVYRAVDGLFGLLLAPNLLRISGYIQQGDMDFILLRPVASQFYVSLRVLNLPELPNALIGMGLVVYAGQHAGVVWTPAGVALAVGFALCGMALLYALWFAVITCAFWFIQIDATDGIFYSILDTAQYPVSFFKGFVRTLLTFVVPVAFATTFPTQALLGVADPWMLVAGLGLSLAAQFATHRFWNYAVRHCSSASS